MIIITASDVNPGKVIWTALALISGERVIGGVVGLRDVVGGGTVIVSVRLYRGYMYMYIQDRNHMPTSRLCVYYNITDEASSRRR